MSRSGYSDDYDDEGTGGLWRGAVKRATEGRRGQVLLRDLLEALDAMPEKRLYRGNFATAEGQYCTLGVLGAKRGTKMDDLGSEEDYDCDTGLVGKRFGIARALAAEIMYENDEGAAYWEKETPEKRWQRIRAWVASQLLAEGHERTP